MTSAAHRRLSLIHVITSYSTWRAGGRATRRQAENDLRAGLARVGAEWAGVLDIGWFSAELRKVKAAPGDYAPGAYEGWRRQGLPAWAARAAGLQPTPQAARHEGSHAAAIHFGEGVDPQTVIDDLIITNQKLRAIMAFRAAHGSSLSEALQAVVARYEQLRIEQPDLLTFDEGWGQEFYS